MRFWNSGLIFDGRSVAIVCFRGGVVVGRFSCRFFVRKGGGKRERKRRWWLDVPFAGHDVSSDLVVRVQDAFVMHDNRCVVSARIARVLPLILI